MHVERLTYDTVPDMLVLLKELHDMSNVKHIPWDQEEARASANMCVDMPNCFGCVAMHDGQVVGVMVGCVVKMIYSKASIGIEEAIYVRLLVPERAKVAAQMLQWFVLWCKDLGAVDIRTGSMAGIDNYAIDVFYRSHGFKRAGMMYSLKEPRT